jgi:glycosyltransferase involved in cell wall biosynthesis
MQRPLRVAMICPPWLPVPPEGYGGIEAAAKPLIESLCRDWNVEVTVFTVGNATVKATQVYSLLPEGLYQRITEPVYRIGADLADYVQQAINIIRADGQFDIIHDNTGRLETTANVWANMSSHMPPVLHTIHDPFNEKALRRALEWGGRQLWVNPISQSQIPRPYPSWLPPRLMGHVYNGLDLTEYPVYLQRETYWLTMGRCDPTKGQAVAARLANAAGHPLLMAGSVATLKTPAEVARELANPVSSLTGDAAYDYYRDEVHPQILSSQGRIQYLGNVTGQHKLNLFGRAAAFLMPIQWPEPFGMVVIEALATGTPVVAMNLGAMSEIIEHGVSGFLAETEAEFAYYLTQVHQIDPLACRARAGLFSAKLSAGQYVKHYSEVISLKNVDKTTF